MVRLQYSCLSTSAMASTSAPRNAPAFLLKSIYPSFDGGIGICGSVLAGLGHNLRHSAYIMVVCGMHT